MFSDETKAIIASWNARKIAQWEKIAPSVEKTEGGVAVRIGLPLMLVRSREAKTQFVVTYSDKNFYEGVTIGQLPELQIEPDPFKPKKYRIVPEDRLDSKFKGVDLSDDQIVAVLMLWRSHKTAATLPFIRSVFSWDGKEYRRA